MFGFLSKGRFEKLKSRRSGSQQRVQTFLKELQKARRDAREANQELEELMDEIEDEIRENRDTIGYCNHALEGAGDLA